MTTRVKTTMPLAEIGQIFPGILDLAGSVAGSTLNEYRLDAGAYLGYCERYELSPLSAGSLRSWRGSMIDSTRMSPNTINRKLAAVKRLFKASAQIDEIPADLAHRVSLVEPVQVRSLRHRLRKDARMKLEPWQVRKLVEAPNPETLLGLRDRALLATLAGSGCRISEIAALQVENIMLAPEGRILRVLGKGQAEPRVAPLSEEAHAALTVWLTARSEHVDVQTVFTGFYGPKGGWRPIARPLSRKGAWRVVRKYAVAVGIKELKPHDLRRFVGTQLAAKDLRSAQLALGHQRLETTTKHYILDQLKPGLTDDLY